MDFHRSDDLTIFKCFRVIFSIKKKTIQFSLLFNLYLQQKGAPKLSVWHLLKTHLLWHMAGNDSKKEKHEIEKHNLATTYDILLEENVFESL